MDKHNRKVIATMWDKIVMVAKAERECKSSKYHFSPVYP